MSEFRRFLSYIYSYRDSVKQKNTGFAKVEARGQILRIQVHIKGMYPLGVSGCQVYGFYRQEQWLRGVLLGEFFLKNGSGDMAVVTDRNGISGTEISLEQLGGIYIVMKDNPNVVMASAWDNDPVDTWHFSVHQGTEKNLEQGNADNKVKDDSEDEYENEHKYEPEDRETSERRTQQGGQQEDSVENGGKVQIESVQAAQKKLSEMECPQQDYRENAENHEGNIPVQSVQLEYVSNSVEKVQTQAKVVTASGNTVGAESTAEKLKKLAPKNQNAVLDRQPEAMEHGKVETADRQSTPEEHPEETVPNRQLSPEEHPEETVTDRQLSPEEHQKIGTMDMAKKQQAQTVDMHPSLEGQQEVQTVDEEQLTREQQSEENNSKEMSEDNRMKEQSFLCGEAALSVDNFQKSSDVCGKKIAWHKIMRKFPVVHPFEHRKELELVRIEPKDLNLLEKSYWALGNNSFLLHGYCSYRYLLLGRNPENNSFFLGVPGIFHPREKLLANMFGFSEFYMSRNARLRQGEFGYYVRPVELLAEDCSPRM